MTPIEWTYIGGAIVYSLLEYWLGKTEAVKAGSLIEAVILAAKSITKKG